MRGPRLAVELWLDYAVGSWWAVSSPLIRRPPQRWSQGSGAPVLLLPGVYEPWPFMLTIGNRLNAAGHPVHVVREIRNNVDEIPDVAAVAQRYLEKHDLEHVAIVAHSKGGLIAKHMMAVNDTAHRIDRVVAVVTPFGGSRMASLMAVRTLRAFRPRNKTIALLAANLELNSRITSIYGEFDAHIPGGSRLEGAVNIQLPIVGHFRLLADERVIRAIVDAVDREQDD